MRYFKAFIAGLVIPSIILPIFLCILSWAGRTEILQHPFLHWIPLLWGFWNALYFAFLPQIRPYLPRDVNLHHFAVGAVLGFLVALYGVFWAHVPSAMGLSGGYYYLPLVAAPILYAVLWRYGVKPLNELLHV